MVIGRWSELSVVWVSQWVERAKSGDERLMSGDVGGWLGGRRVGVSVLRVQYVDCEIWVERSAPRVSVIEEYQRGSWALKSPRINVGLLGAISRWLMDGWESVGHDEVGGM